MEGVIDGWRAGRKVDGSRVGKTLTIKIEVADDTSDESLPLAEQVAREAAVLLL
jgi:hypothetical protein